MALSAVLPRAKQASTRQPNAKPVPAKKQAAAVDLQEVARVAYALYEKRGRLDGYDKRDWFEAERLVVERQRRSR